MQAAIRSRILASLSLGNGWTRGTMRSLLHIARERGWELMHAPLNEAIGEVVRTWHPAVLVTEGIARGMEQGRIDGTPIIAANVDLTSHGIPSICVDDAAVSVFAAKHLLETGQRHVAAFTYSDTPFGQARVAAFRQYIGQHGAVYHPGGEFSADPTQGNYCGHDAIQAWLTRLPKPCGVFAGCDMWARPVAAYCRQLGLRIPEDIALVGADNDTLICELTAPPLSSVAVSWRDLGERVAGLVEDCLHHREVLPTRTDIQPIAVVSRRSSDVLAIEDPDVLEAVRWIRKNAHRPVSVPDVLRAIPVYRQKLERRFRAVLGRTVMEEVRRSHVELAKALLVKTRLTMPGIAERCGFTNATLLGIAFHKETGLTPSAYRRMCDQEGDEEPA